MRDVQENAVGGGDENYCGRMCTRGEVVKW